MKNTAKKILALVFAVAMICTMAVPAFATGAEDETLDVNVQVVNLQKNATYGYIYSGWTSINPEDIEEGDTLHDVLKAVDASTEVELTYSATKGISRDLLKDALEADDAEGKWVVAVNGVVVDAYKDYVMADDDKVVIYWADSVMETKLIMADYEKLLSGVVSYYYLDAEGNRQPVEGMKFRIYTHATKNTETGKQDYHYIPNRLSDDNSVWFVTDEAGQIWIAPQDLEAITNKYGKLYYSSTVIGSNDVVADAVYGVAPSDTENWDEKVAEYYDNFGALNYVHVAALRATDVLLEDDSYNAPNTGDMTMVYVLVAAAAVVTLGAVVVMKKKAVKAN